jgi:hypothetical protein
MHDFAGPTAPRREAFIHVRKVAGPDAGLVAADAGADLDDDRADGAVLRAHEQPLNRTEKLRGAMLRGLEIRLGHLGQFAVLIVGDHGAQPVDFRLDGAEPAPVLDERLERAAAGGDITNPPMVREHLLVEQLRAKGLELALCVIQASDEVLRSTRHDRQLYSSTNESPPRAGGGLCQSDMKASLLLLLSALEVFAGEFLLEFLDPAGGVHERLLPGEVGMRARPHLDVHLGHRGPDGHDVLAAEIDLAVWVVLGVDIGFHRGSPRMCGE